MIDYPGAITAINHVEPVPRRIRAYLAGELVLDTINALYVWEWPYYPQYYIPRADVRSELLVDEGTTHPTRRGVVRDFALQVHDTHRAGVARLVEQSPVDRLAGTVRFDWAGLDSWFEEGEQVFVHPRNPYVRVDALRSSRTMRVELDGVVLAASDSPVLVFETGLPTRYYVDRTDVDFSHLVTSPTQTECPYKGVTTDYWSVQTEAGLHPDLAWSYSFPTRQLLPIAGLVAFYNEKVDIAVDGVVLPRPETHFFS
jgi:uncharacterized protein (DUF427 family)